MPDDLDPKYGDPFFEPTTWKHLHEMNVWERLRAAGTDLWNPYCSWSLWKRRHLRLRVPPSILSDN